MTAKFLRYKLGKIAIAITVLAITTLSCTDDLAYRQDADGPSGEKAVISLSFEVGEPKRLTRADIDEDDAKRVNTIWVGIYNASTGDNTAKVYITSGQHGFTAGTNNHVKSILTDIPTKSGKSYIVAVANPDQYVGITTEDDPDNENAKKSLTELLANAKSWDAYKSIIVTGVAGQNNSVDIQAPAINENQGLLMSGIYTEASHDDPSLSHPDISETSYYIPAGENTLTGAIHLRRLISHINFNIQASGTIVEITPQSYQVHNVPFASWLHERVEDNPSSDNRIGYANAGDAIEPSYTNNNLYRNSLVFTSTSFDKEVENNITSYSFDFWMMENKREGIQNFRDGMTDNERYATREQEYDVDGKYDPTAQSGTVKSSGIFVSLSGFDTPSLNNRAAYVDIPCVVKYRSVTSNGNGPGSSNPGVTDDEGLLNPGAVRTANITYRIHLGYINKNAKDFNSYRNSDYTYNVKISDLHSVIVEAFRKGDPQPGGFGDVTDVSDKFFELDAHYGVFNIFLDETDLAAFSYRLLCYENNQPHEIIGGSKEVDNPDTPITAANEKYYNWVTLVYTGNTVDSEENEAKLAPYPGKDEADLLYLNDLLPNNSRVAPSPGWYTVYINEHVYETSADETGGNWKSYVNQPDRMLWINVAQKISADGSSVFYKAKYAAAQRSIQTYYNTVGDNVSNAAIGVEHENENFGMNIRWTSAVSTSGLNADNGRWNVWSKLGDTEKDRRWGNFISLNVLQKVNPITNNKLPSTVTTSQKNGGFRYVPMINTLTGLNSTMGGHPNYENAATASATDYDPQNSGNIQYIQAMYACMNRNRDEDGSGAIEESELKWYLPASGKYLRVILGRNSLSTPILNYVNNEALPYKEKAQDAFFLLVSSDNKVIWAVEGMSSSPFVGTSYCAPPWQVRCIRNLGTNLNNEITNSREDGVEPAYSETVSGTSAIVRVEHYYGTSLRNPTTTPLPVHKTNSEYNRLARYGFEVAYIGNNSAEPYYKTEEEIPSDARSSAANFMNYLEGDLAITGWDGSVTHYIPCESLNNGTKKGWRVPNQKELTIMLRLKILTSHANDQLFTSCTTEYWDNAGSSSTSLNLNNYRLAAARVWDNGMTQAWYNDMRRIRCVRDLQPGE